MTATLQHDAADRQFALLPIPIKLAQRVNDAKRGDPRQSFDAIIMDGVAAELLRIEVDQEKWEYHPTPEESDLAFTYLFPPA